MICAHCAILNAMTDISENKQNQNFKPFEIVDNVLYAYSDLVVYSYTGSRMFDLTKGYSKALKKGVYFVRVGGKMHKVLAF